MSRELVKNLGLEVDDSVSFGVCLGHGARVACQGVCRALQVDPGDCQIQTQGYLF